MSVSSTTVSTATSQIASVASWLSRAGAEHAGAHASSRQALASLPSVWRGPAATLAQARGQALVSRTAPVADHLGVASLELSSTVSQGEPIASRLRQLEQEEMALENQAARARSALGSESDPLVAQQQQRELATLEERLRRVRWLHAEQQATWEQVCQRAANQISGAAAQLRAAAVGVLDVASSDGRATSGGSSSGVRGLLQRLVDGLGHITDWFDVADNFVEELRKRLTRVILHVRTRVVMQARELVLVVGHHLAVRARQVYLGIERTRRWILVPPPRWLQRVSTVFRVARPAMQAIGKRLPVVAGVMAGWERWERDAARPDTTSTERWLRAATEGVWRTLPQILIAKGTAAAATAVAGVSGPFAVVTVPLVIAAGIGVGVAVDKGMQWLTNMMLDEWQFTQSLIRGSADVIDATGRFISDLASEGASAVSNAWSTVTDVGSSIASGVSSAASSAWDAAVDTVTSTAVDVVSTGVSTATRIVDAGTSVASDVVATASDAVDDVKSSVSSVASSAVSGAYDVTRSMTSTAGTFASRPVSLVTSLWP